MKHNPISKDQIISAAIGITCVGFELLRRGHYVKDTEMLATIATSAAVGHRLGSTVGRVFMGPAGHLAGLAAGCLVGVALATAAKKHAQLATAPSKNSRAS